MSSLSGSAPAGAKDAWRGETVMVSGASGFLGGHLMACLLEQGARIVATSRASREDRSRPIRWRKVDLSVAAEVEAAVAEEKPAAIFHLSSMADAKRDLSLVQPTFEADVVSTLNILTAAARTPVRSLVLSGSLETPDRGAVPTSPYAAAKACSQLYAETFKALYGVPVVATRIFMCYGPGQPDWKLIPSVTAELLAGRTPAIASPDREVDWIFAPDAAQGLVAASVHAGPDTPQIDIGTGRAVTIRALVEQLRDIAQPGLPLDFSAARPRAEVVRIADADATCALTGWRAKTPLETGLRATVAALRARRDA